METKNRFFEFFYLGLIFLIFACYAFTSSRQKINIENVGLTLPSGFKAAKIIENKGKARHLVVTANGEIYVKLFRLVNGKGILLLSDDDKDGSYSVKSSFGDYAGTGIAIKNGYLYASSDKEVFRYKLDDQQHVINPNQPEKIITGLFAGRQHQTKSLVLDEEDNIYVNIGANTNSCQIEDGGLRSLGVPGCPLLDSTGGIWRFKAHQLNQSYKQGERYATGLRNVMGLDWNHQNNTLYVMQHGRDNLHSSWPELYTDEQSAELPSECMYMIKKGDNAGWPYIYYDHLQKKKILAPEYGGDGKKEGSKEYINPIVAFPGHMAPNALLFYKGDMFPEKYKNGAFVAFHGSWNRSPLPQEGFYVAFIPFKNGIPYGEWEVFANGFAGKGKIISNNEAKNRPCGLAEGPDGALYVSDDLKGAIYKITYHQ